MAESVTTTEETPKEAERVFASWTIELWCECPHCEAYVDLLDADDFWEDHRFDLAEHNTDRTKNVEVLCPKCSKQFEVCLEY
jgi:Zn finger protein HypA/HybF involved in hydrogenase expression